MGPHTSYQRSDARSWRVRRWAVMNKSSDTARSGAAMSGDVRQTLDALRRIIQALRGEHGSPHADRGLTTAQRFALQQIAEHPHSSVNQIAALTFTHQSSVSVVIGRLVERGLVAKVTAASDRRSQVMEVTATGRQLLRRDVPLIQERLIAGI